VHIPKIAEVFADEIKVEIHKKIKKFGYLQTLILSKKGLNKKQFGNR